MAHNAAFDIAVIRESTTHCGFEWPTLDFGCSLLLARRHYDHSRTHPRCRGRRGGNPAATVTTRRPRTPVRLRADHRGHGPAGGLIRHGLDDLLQISGIAWGRMAPDHHEPLPPDESGGRARQATRPDASSEKPLPSPDKDDGSDPPREERMQLFLDCLPCLLRQVLEAARMGSPDEATQGRIMDEAMVTLTRHRHSGSAAGDGPAMHESSTTHRPGGTRTATHQGP
jgi:hypothetical protein